MMKAMLVAMLGLGATVAAQAETVPFPGATAFPIAALGTDGQIARTLYAGSHFALTGSDVCPPRRPCGVAVKASLHWRDATGQAHLGLVMAAENADAAHADGALIGMADLVHTPGGGWVFRAGSPLVAEQGSFGKAPDITLLTSNSLGMIVIMQPSTMNQGQIRRDWNLFAETRDDSTFKQRLSLPRLIDSSGYCPDAQCRAGDFATKTTVFDVPNGVRVEHKTIYFDGKTTDESYFVGK